MVAVFEPKIIEVVGETGKGTVGVYPFVTGRGTSVRDVLESALDIEAEVIVDEEFQTA
jgi:hypothetical protein